MFFSLFRPIVRALIATSDFAPFSQSSDLKKFSLSFDSPGSDEGTNENKESDADKIPKLRLYFYIGFNPKNVGYSLKKIYLIEGFWEIVVATGLNTFLSIADIRIA